MPSLLADNPALRYLPFALLGSILYLLGGVLLYGACRTLDIVMLSGRVQADLAAAGARWR